jgi:hypothetical protein
MIRMGVVFGDVALCLLYLLVDSFGSLKKLTKD